MLTFLNYMDSAWCGADLQALFSNLADRVLFAAIGEPQRDRHEAMSESNWCLHRRDLCMGFSLVVVHVTTPSAVDAQVLQGCACTWCRRPCARQMYFQY